jgi:murein L,D-transpeptidase YcbB/YkuD
VPLPFNSIEDAEAFIAAARQAEEAKKSDDQKRQEELDRREQELASKEAAATARERAAIRRAAVLSLGATGEDLADALAILERDLAATPDADEATVTAAAEALKVRRPALFGVATTVQTPNGLPPAPGGAPAGGPPPRQTPSGKPGDRGREMARIRGHIKDSNAA